MSIGAHGKRQIKKILKYKKLYFSTTIYTYCNNQIILKPKQINEIINNALVVVATSVDLQVIIWAIQWPNDYIVQTL
jgi:hypothetical protein